ncbi:hypothetical protein [Calothrix sp. CCY 0018]|uniref:hypothetical protein n=1 Tax=Calothrix sp. CCY 0018 TaxID=3103864 RepID=UPI0039C736C5
MPKKKCGLGFDCASMMIQPGIDPSDCLNYQTCGSAYELTPDEQLELIRVRERRWEELQQARAEAQQEQQRIQERILISRKQAARMMLISRGCPQSLDSLGITYLITNLTEQLSQLSQQLAEATQDQYIPPRGVEVHQYNVKRGRKIFEYNKLTASEAIFKPIEKTREVTRNGIRVMINVEAVRMIHLSRDDDARNIVARESIKLRNKLLKVETLLKNAQQLIEEVGNLIES